MRAQTIEESPFIAIINGIRIPIAEADLDAVFDQLTGDKNTSVSDELEERFGYTQKNSGNVQEVGRPVKGFEVSGRGLVESSPSHSLTASSAPHVPSSSPALSRAQLLHGARAVWLARWFPNGMRVKKPAAKPSPIILPAKWRKLNLTQRYLAAIRAARAHQGYGFSLNLSESIASSIGVSLDPLRTMQERMNLALRRYGISGVPLAFSLEATESFRLHLHGVIVPGPDLDLNSLKLALREAGGSVTRSTKARQLDLRPIDNADGWHGYIMKAANQTSDQLTGRARTYISTPMSRLARDHHAKTWSAPKLVVENPAARQTPEIAP